MRIIIIMILIPLITGCFSNVTYFRVIPKDPPKVISQEKAKIQHTIEPLLISSRCFVDKSAYGGVQFAFLLIPIPAFGFADLEFTCFPKRNKSYKVNSPSFKRSPKNYFQGPLLKDIRNVEFFIKFSEESPYKNITSEGTFYDRGYTSSGTYNPPDWRFSLRNVKKKSNGSPTLYFKVAYGDDFVEYIYSLNYDGDWKLTIQ